MDFSPLSLAPASTSQVLGLEPLKGTPHRLAAGEGSVWGVNTQRDPTHVTRRMGLRQLSLLVTLFVRFSQNKEYSSLAGGLVNNVENPWMSAIKRRKCAPAVRAG